MYLPTYRYCSQFHYPIIWDTPVLPKCACSLYGRAKTINLKRSVRHTYIPTLLHCLSLHLTT
jgi:hypothetical protein